MSGGKTVQVKAHARHKPKRRGGGGATRPKSKAPRRKAKAPKAAKRAGRRVRAQPKRYGS